VATYQLLGGIRLVMNRVFVDDGLRSLVHTHDFNLDTFAPEVDYYLVQSSHGGDVPKVRLGQINDNLIQVSLKSKDSKNFSVEAKKTCPITS